MRACWMWWARASLAATNGAFDRATFRTPQGLALSADGATLFVADTGNHLIRAIDLNARTVKTAAGTGQQARGPSDGGAASSTSLSSPWDLAMHGPLLFIAMAGDASDLDAGHDARLDLAVCRLRPRSARRRHGGRCGVRATVGADDCERDDVRGGQRIEHHPRDRAAAGQSREHACGRRPLRLRRQGWRRATPSASSIRSASRITTARSTSPTPTTTASSASIPRTRRVTTFAGTGRPGHQDGPAAKAQFYEPGGLTVAGDRLYVADTNNHAIRAINLSDRRGRRRSEKLLEAAGPLGSNASPPAEASAATGPAVALQRAAALRRRRRWRPAGRAGCAFGNGFRGISASRFAA